MADNYMDKPSFEWRWQDLCGEKNLVIYDKIHHDLGLCFQQLGLQIPVLFLLAITSAYFFGYHTHYVLRGRVQLNAIKCRCLVVFLLIAMPIVQLYVDIYNTDVPVKKISVFLSAVQVITWITHFGYMLVLRHRLGLSPRGPVAICVLWSLYAVLTVMSFRTHLLIMRSPMDINNNDFSARLAFGCSLINCILQFLYALTLVPSEGTSTSYADVQHSTNNERQPLLSSGSTYERFLEEPDPHYLGAAMEDAPWLSRLLFYWVNPLMNKGVLQKLNHPDDLFDLPRTLSTASISLKLERALIGNVDKLPRDSPEHVVKKKYHVSLLVALHRCFAWQFYSIGFLKLVSDCSGFFGPLLLNKLVSFIENKEEDIRMGYLYAFGLFLTTIIGAFCNSHFNFYMSVVGLKIRSSLVTAVYRKTLNVSSSTLNKSFSIGEIVNFMSIDTDRIVNSCPSFHALWSIPFQLAVTLYLLYRQVGLAFLAGVAFSVILIPINKFIANKIGNLSTKMMERKDERVKMMTEVLRGIRTVKLHVWEQHFLKTIAKLRESEMKFLKGRKYLDALCVYFWVTTPVLISILTFGTYVWLGNKLTAATVFTCMALLNMLIGPLNAFPWVLNGMTEAWVSIKRIQKILDLQDLDLDEFYTKDPVEASQTTLSMKDIKFHIGRFGKSNISKTDSRKSAKKGKKSVKFQEKSSDSTQNELESTAASETASFEEYYIGRIDLTIKKGEFIGIMGVVGSGKSNLLLAILAEFKKTEGDIFIDDLDAGFGYVSQQPWLQRGTIRENILFGKAYDDSRYKSVLSACGLAEDIYLFPSGDLTGIGEGGVTLSGGQKARIALARAVYQDKPIYLLDDVISAVDVNVAKHIFQNCIMGLLKQKTRILCTHHVKFLTNCDKLIVMDSGKITEIGKPSDIMSEYDDFQYDNECDLELEGENNQNVKNDTNNRTGKSKEDSNSILEEESRETGTVQTEVYGSYWKAIGHLLSLAIILSLVLMQTSRNMSDWWLSYWVTNANNTNNNNASKLEAIGIATSGNSNKITINEYHQHPIFTISAVHADYGLEYYMGIYGGFVGLNTVFTLFRAFLFAYGGITAATNLHRSLLKSVLKSKILFFDISPLGRILNRFSSDTYTVDDSLPFILNILLAQVFGVIGSIIVTVYGLPWLCLILVPLVPVYHWLQHHYRITSRELKRLSSVTLSPVYSHFNETLQGLPTIRALRATQRFKRDNEDNVESNQKAQYASQAASQWLGLRLQFIGVAVVSGVGVIAVLQHQFDVADAGLVGLAISYALSVTGLLSGVVNAFTETEREMIAVERVKQYIDELVPESSSLIIDPPYGWPSQGVVSFNNVILRYREHLTPSLKGITFETRPCEKIGVVGRTGAGKSSLFVALFRLTEIYSGFITIDTVNLKHISITALRSRLSIIPQDPFLFSGTIRENLDPLEEFRETELWEALNRVDLASTVRRFGGLGAIVDAGGSNLSVGQRQLVCLARAVLHKSQVLCVDEATANVDQETDRLIQQTIRHVFRKSTVITIAHRIDTIMDYDRVLVMGDGQVLEFDKPDVLLEDPSSHFYQLVQEIHEL